MLNTLECDDVLWFENVLVHACVTTISTVHRSKAKYPKPSGGLL